MLYNVSILSIPSHTFKFSYLYILYFRLLITSQKRNWIQIKESKPNNSPEAEVKYGCFHLNVSRFKQAPSWTSFWRIWDAAQIY